MIRNDEGDHSQYGTLIRRILVTLLTGGLTFMVTNMSDEPLSWVLTITIYISGVTLVIQWINDFERHLKNVVRKLENRIRGQEGHSNEVRSMIEEGFARTNEATELFRAVEASSLRTDIITQLVRNSTQIEPTAPPLVNEFAQWQISRTSQFLKELSEGGVVCHDGEDLEWLLELTRKSEHTIDATSLSTVDAGPTSFHDGLWTSDFGQRYLDLQRDAVSREVVIRRIFIFDSHKQTIDDEFLRIYRQQRDLGIHTRALDRFVIPHSLKNLLFDFIVFDDTISYEVTPGSRIEDATKPTIIKTSLTLQPQRVKERIRKFEDLWVSAQELE